ncbi:response regulator [Pontibacillus litoralis]|uniref:Transcriptional regulator n=1 Tax=Pontibacillus litoralis JSM 072002 TaxID=1385512 RepID=A0A0A5G1C8_9BACI|nr:response regulator [Pontibacillus litoralis]KGX85849.1 transcriptional regulator [Pontibacillus litoralis JSM 072002]
MIEVLIVEDDPMVLQVNEMYLNEVDGFHLKGKASSALEAIQLINTHEFDLILLDIYMPQQNGLELLKRIRQQDINIDVIIISAASDTRSIQIALQHGAYDYIIKPFQFIRFKDALIKYQQKNHILQQQKLRQEELDKYLLDMSQSHSNQRLPKGLTTNTLTQIWNHITSLEENSFSIEDLVDAIHISRTSIRKYVQFLEQIDVLTSYTTYGHVGRPLTLYQYVESNQTNIDPYL